MMRLNC